MLNKITATAISTVLCLTSAIPCTSDCSDQQLAETYAAIAASPVVQNNAVPVAEPAPDKASAVSGSTITTVSETDPEISTEPVDEEPVEEGSLGASISYKLYEDGTLYINGRGIMNNYSKSPFKSPELISKAIVTNEDGEILTIGSCVFLNCTNLTGIELPNTLITIEESAFANCSALSHIQFGGFVSEENGELLLSESIEEIKENAFKNCTSLESVIVPEQTVSIGTNAFAGCTYLKKAVIRGEKTSLSNSIFNRCVSLEDLTLPFAGFDPDAVNEDDPIAWLGFLFGEAVGDDTRTYTYAVRCYNGNVRHVPLTLKNVTVSGGKNIPSYAFDGFSSLEKIAIPDDIKIIGDAAFRNCSSLTKFDMPKEATFIGDEAFANCAGISVDIPEGVTQIGSRAFENCTSVTEINVPEITETIGDNAFAGCTYLKKAVIRGRNTQLSGYIFARCISLEDLTLPFAGFDPDIVNEDDSIAWLGFLFGSAVGDESTSYTYAVRCYNGNVRHLPLTLKSVTVSGGKNIPAYAFDGFSSLEKIAIPDDIKIIGDAAFRNCNALTKFDMPKEATFIGDEAFANCAGISVDIPEGVTQIGSSAFENCTSITEINVPEATTLIGDSAFAGCTYLKNAAIRGGNIKLSNSIFARCISLEDLTLPFAGFNSDSVNEDDSIAWLGFLFGAAVGDDSTSYTYAVKCYNGNVRHIPLTLKSVTVSGGKNIPAYAFDGFSSLEKIAIPDDISIIGAHSFRNCSALTKFDMPKAATFIGDEAFANCAGISVDIPEGVTQIGSKAFENCTSITEITVPEATTVIGDSAFAGCTYLKKAVIRGGSKQIGNSIFSRCISLEELTLPFTAFNEESANTENETTWLGYMFGEAVGDDSTSYTYAVKCYNGNVRHIPNSLKDISFTDGKYIPNYLLQGLNGIENVTLPEAIKEIGSRAFEGCQNLLNVFYPGSEEAWENVNVKEKNEEIDGKVRFLGEGAVTTPPATTVTTTTVSTTTTTTTTAPTTTTPDVQPTYTLGDTNDDGVIDATDASNILALYAKISTGYDEPTEHELNTSDVDRDGAIDATDASTVLSYYAYISTAEDELSLEEFMKKK